MKTLSFHNFKVGRSPKRTLLQIHSEADHVQFQSGLNLLVAPNGYGKTTLLQTLAGVLGSLGGEALLDGLSIDREKRILYISEYLTFPKYIYPLEWVQYVAGKFGDLDSWIEGFSLQKLMNQFLGKMSQGERRKVTWLAAQASERPILLLDEPLDGLDLLAIESARKMILEWKKQGRIVCLVAHQVAEVLDLSDQVWLFQDQRLKAWSTLFPDTNRPSEIELPEFRKKVYQFYSFPR